MINEKKQKKSYFALMFVCMLSLDATPQKRWLGFDFKFKKISIKQAIVITDIFPSRVKAAKQKKI